MMQIAQNSVVAIAYTLTDDNGTVIDTSAGGEPLVYLHGARNIIPGLENALAGKAIGDKLQVTIAPVDGYGEYDAQMVQSVPRQMFAGVDNIEVGMQFQAQTDHGIQVVTIAAVEGDEVTVDGNHPLAGVQLNFDVEVMSIRAATEEELAHGHVHGPDGHHHH
ncbi:MAG: peptidylprolyl isomerase [Fluviicoccus sp.]|uniref:peptidylprolyl isomerase n=1 Tax=Fluviicoccus sp. TaxID=2003552 RepID=UPI00271BA4E2|nr:peptidylprolyl isomerase [Fluviicoccus sp.]MDO8330388.1 peptidylprolyl isomerase [Fluviicoccus sp.]